MWLDRLRGRRLEQARLDLETWLDLFGGLTELFLSSLQISAMPTDLVVTLSGIDSRLEGLNARAIRMRGLLRRSDPALGARVKHATDQAWRLRNQMVSFFIRWQDFQDADRERRPDRFDRRRGMEEALVAANQTARGLASEFQALSSLARDRMAAWPTSL
jgi:hypothetical protein